jgi:hypothetical protein
MWAPVVAGVIEAYEPIPSAQVTPSGVSFNHFSNGCGGAGIDKAAFVSQIFLLVHQGAPQSTNIPKKALASNPYRWKARQPSKYHVGKGTFRRPAPDFNPPRSLSEFLRGFATHTMPVWRQKISYERHPFAVYLMLAAPPWDRWSVSTRRLRRGGQGFSTAGYPNCFPSSP